MKYAKGGKDPEKWKEETLQHLADAEALMRGIDQQKVSGSLFNPPLTDEEAEKIIRHDQNKSETPSKKAKQE